jgi:hypothetical protein
MNRAEAQELVASASGRVCVRFYRRADGTVLTTNCPIGLRAARAKVAAGLARIAAALALLLAGALALGLGRVPGAARLRSMEPFATVCGWLSAAPARGRVIMGEVCIPPPPAGNGVSGTR